MGPFFQQQLHLLVDDQDSFVHDCCALDAHDMFLLAAVASLVDKFRGTFVIFSKLKKSTLLGRRLYSCPLSCDSVRRFSDAELAIMDQSRIYPLSRCSALTDFIDVGFPNSPD
jgi:hypothetical protein